MELNSVKENSVRQFSAEQYTNKTKICRKAQDWLLALPWVALGIARLHGFLQLCPYLWNALPQTLRESESSLDFHKQREMYLPWNQWLHYHCWSLLYSTILCSPADTALVQPSLSLSCSLSLSAFAYHLQKRLLGMHHKHGFPMYAWSAVQIESLSSSSISFLATVAKTNCFQLRLEMEWHDFDFCLCVWHHKGQGWQCRMHWVWNWKLSASFVHPSC